MMDISDEQLQGMNDDIKFAVMALKCSDGNMEVSEKMIIFEKIDDMYLADNKDCAIYVNGFDATFKKVKLNQNGITLIPYNQDNTDGFETTYYDEEQITNLPIKIIGIAREKRTRL